MKVLIDTNIYINALSGHSGAQQVLVENDEILVPSVMLGELEYGFRNGSKYNKNKNHLEYFLGSENISVVFSSLQTAEIYGRLKNQLRKNGTPIPENDVWIAALSIETASTLATFDVYFKSIPSLKLLLF